MKTRSTLKKLLAAATSVVFLTGVAIAGFAAPADANSPTFVKYGETFTYGGNGQWTITNSDADQQLNNIGNNKSGFLCSYNNVGAGITKCTTGDYTFTGDTSRTGYNCAYIQGDGGAINGSWDTVPGDSTKSVCVSTTTTPQDASAVIVDNAATCSSAETVSEGAILNATWSPITYSGQNDNTYTAIATATAGHEFPTAANVTDNNTVETITATLASKLTSGCSVPPACIPNSAISYQYTANDDNAGWVKVADVPGSTGVLCYPLYVTATSWKFTNNSSIWPQTLDITDKLGEISTPGTYDFAAKVTCGQGDIYASTDASAPSLNPGPTLTNPSTPFTESFLSDLGYSGGTSPTYTVDNASCWTQPETGAPTTNAAATCEAPTNTLTLPAVPGGVWTVSKSSYSQSYGSGDSVSLTSVPAGYGDYTVTLVDGSSSDGFTVTGGWWTWHTVSLASLGCASTGAPVSSMSTCVNTDDNDLTLPAVAGGQWTVTGPNDYDFQGASLSLTEAPSGYGQYTITLADADGSDQYSVTGGTWYWTPFDASTGCLVPTGTPTASDIALCGTSGSIDIPVTDGVTYFLDGSIASGTYTGLSGTHIVTAVATNTIGGYTLSGYPADGWTFDLGSVTTCDVSYQLSGSCTSDGTSSEQDVQVTLDNSTSTGTSTFIVNGVSYPVAGGNTEVVDAGDYPSTGGTITVNVNGTEDDQTVAAFTGCLPTAVPADPSASPATCDAQTGSVNNDAFIKVDLEPGLSYTITGPSGFVTITGLTLQAGETAGSQIVATGVPAGDYTVTVVAVDGYVLDSSITTPKWPFDLPVTQTTCDFGATAQPVDCATNAAGVPTITIEPNPDLVYTATETDTDAQTVLTDEVTNMPAGKYTVTVSLSPNAPANSALPTTGLTFGPFDLSTICTLPTLPTWDASATGADGCCTSTSATDGTIDLTHDADQTGDVIYTVVDTSTSKTVYSGTNTEAGDTILTVPAGTYHVVAAPSDPTEAGLSGNPNEDGTEDWTIDITQAGIDCAGTLAYTGGTIAWLGIMLAGGMLFLGFGLLYMRRRGHRAA